MTTAGLTDCWQTSTCSVVSPSCRQRALSCSCTNSSCHIEHRQTDNIVNVDQYITLSVCVWRGDVQFSHSCCCHSSAALSTSRLMVARSVPRFPCSTCRVQCRDFCSFHTEFPHGCAFQSEPSLKHESYTDIRITCRGCLPRCMYPIDGLPKRPRKL